jgi:2-hydroxychromene-2-carboxylate isomerase
MNPITRQKGAADSNPSKLKRWLLSQLMTHVISDARQAKERKNKESRRDKEGRRRVVEYFHQVDDGYSHLTIQVLEQLMATYDVDLVVHLVRRLSDANTPEPQLLQDISYRDSAIIAPYFGLTFPNVETAPSRQLVDLAQSIFTGLTVRAFITDGVLISDCLWRSDEAGLRVLARKWGLAPHDSVMAALKKGAERRAELKHYSGAMFYFEGEWYWGVDRLSHLEKRLRQGSAVRTEVIKMIAPKPQIAKKFPNQATEMTLEYFVSLRSPYTAISWQPTLDLAAAAGVNLKVRPVLPMVMRGVPATFQKGFYVWKDAWREARDLGVEFGNFYDPIGKPIEKAYSLYMWALDQGRGHDFFGALLQAAFAKGINTNNRSGLRRVVDMAGLDWNEAQKHLDDNNWQQMVEQNQKAMYDCGIWGVPSYRLLDKHGNSVINVWGQDRLWLVSRKIQENA